MATTPAKPFVDWALEKVDPIDTTLRELFVTEGDLVTAFSSPTRRAFDAWKAEQMMTTPRTPHV